MSFLQDYEIVTKNNEVPRMFHHFAALVALSSIVSSRIWLDMGLFIIRPNLYVILTGTPGVKKTTAMSVAKRLLRELGDAVPMSAEAVTKEALTLDMSNYAKTCKAPEGTVPKQFAPIDEDKSKFIYSPMSVFVTELSNFVGSSDNMVDFLTTIYDEEYHEVGTKNKGRDKIRMPYLTMLACTVPEWVTKQMKLDVISSGFCRRTIFVYEYANNIRVALPKITKEMEDAWDRLVKYSRKLLRVSGPMQWGEGALDFYVKWYESLKRPDDPIMEGWYNSVHVQMLKMAMLISMSESEERVIDINHMELSLELISLIENNIPKVFKGVGRNELYGISTKLLEFLEKSPNNQLPERAVMEYVFKEADPTEIIKIINHLISTKQVKRIVDPTTKQRCLKLLRVK